MNDAGVVNHLYVDEDGIFCLNDLIVAVVGIRQHRRCGRQEHQTLILQSRVFGALRVPLRLDPGAA